MNSFSFQKQLYNQSKSYGERIRYRNFAIQHATETSRSHRHSVPLIEELQVNLNFKFYFSRSV
jgi:hypothetical protein